MSEFPTLGKIVGISMSIVVDKNRNNDCPDTTAQISLPSGFELVSGDLYWKGTVMKAGPPVEVNALVEAIKEG